MRVMLFHITADKFDMDGPPSPEALAAFKAMDKFTKELVEAGVFVAAAGLQNSADARRVVYDGENKPSVIDGPFTEARELVAGFSIWEVKDMDEAMAWVARMPEIPGAKGALEIRPFYEAEDLGAFVSEEDLATPRTGDRGKLGVA